MTSINDINIDLLEEIALLSPQLKTVMEDLDIIDVRDYGYEFPGINDRTEKVTINGRIYEVKMTPLKLYDILVRRESSQSLSLSQNEKKEIYDCYCEIVNNKKYFDIAMKRDEFRETYRNHQNGEKTFKLMQTWESIVANILFYLYH